MQFSPTTILQTALCASTVSALAMPGVREPTTWEPGTALGDEATPADATPRDVLSPRVLPVILTVGTFVGTSAAGAAISVAVNEAYKKSKGFFTALWKWDDTREAFTRTTVDNMWANNPEKAGFPGAVCYNMGYDLVPDAQGFSAKVSAKLAQGLLHTDYDCLYVKKGNRFETKGDGGLKNLAYQYDWAVCKFDEKSGDLQC